MDKKYWIARVAEYKEMIRHIKEQRETAEPQDRRKLAVELERLFNEIRIIKEHLGEA